MAHMLTPCLYFGDEDVLYKNVLMGSGSNVPVECHLADGSDVMTPTYVVGTNTMLNIDYNGSTYTPNYLFDSFWNRWYYVRKIVSLPGNRFGLICEQDVLYSHRTAISNWDVFVVRNGDDSAWGFVTDNRYPVDPNRSVLEYYDFGQNVLSNDVNGMQYVLTTV